MGFLDLFKSDSRSKIFFSPSKNVNKIEGKEIYAMFINASIQLDEHRDYLNKINVFPVPDGDTGSNLTYTVRSVKTELENEVEKTESLQNLAKLITRTTMLNSRGNSGTVISQFFNGFCDGFKDEEFVDSKVLIKCFENGKKVAFEAFIEPKKGTILDMIDESAKIVKEAGSRNNNLVEILQITIERLSDTLEKTKEILPENRQANVADAGAVGFMYILAGFLAGIKNTKINFSENVGETKKFGVIETSDLEYRFCTECVFNSNDQKLTKKTLENQIKNLGDSVLVAEYEGLFKVHVHTNTPEKLRNICEDYGDVQDFKIDDMQKMQEENFETKEHFLKEKKLLNNQVGSKEKIAIVVDSSTDFPEEWLEKYPIKVVDFAVYSDEDNQKDLSGELIGEAFYTKMKEGGFQPKTAQPSAKNYFEAYREFLKLADRVICLPISKELSGSYNSATEAKKLLDEPEKVNIIDSGWVAGANGILLGKILEEIEKGTDSTEIINKIYSLKNKLKIYFAVKNIIYLERGGRLSKIQSLFGKLLKVSPVLTVEEGKVLSSGEKVVFGNLEKNANFLVKKVQSLIKKKNKLNSKIIIHYTDLESKVEAEKMKEKILENNPEIENIKVLRINSVIGAHVGPGSLGVVVL